MSAGRCCLCEWTCGDPAMTLRMVEALHHEHYMAEHYEPVPDPVEAQRRRLDEALHERRERWESYRSHAA